MAKTSKPELSPEEKAAAAEKRKANLAAANKKRTELAKANKPPVEENVKPLQATSPAVTEEETAPIPEISKEFEAILPDIKAGKEVTLEGEKDVYFKYEDERLRKYSKNGGSMDAYPLYGFQNREGWALKTPKK